MNVKLKEELYKLYLGNIRLIKMKAELHRRLLKKLNDAALDEYVDVQLKVDSSRRSMVKTAQSNNVSKQDFNDLLNEFSNQAMEDLTQC